MLPMIGASVGLGLAGSLMNHADARKQAAAKAAAYQAAMAREKQLSKREALAQYGAGGVRQGELLAHLQRIAGPGAQAGAEQYATDRGAEIDALAGPASSAPAGGGAGADVQAAALAQAQQRQGLASNLDMAQALMGGQDRGRMFSARSGDTAASRVLVPLQETLYKLAQQRMQNQAQLQAALGDVGPGWMGVAGQAMSGASALPMMFA